MSYGVKAP